MKVHVLTDNRSVPGGPRGEHGLSLHLESEAGSILFDTGQSDMFSGNAEIMAVDLSEVRMAVISHGHYDHGGGIPRFLEVNGSAPVYVHRKAFDRHLALRSGGRYEDIGLDPGLMDDARMVLTSGKVRPGDGITIFSEVGTEYPVSESNRSLFAGSEGNVRPDDFEHEQHMIVEEGGKSVLITGCAHRGIVNIVAEAKEILGRYPDLVMGGFHLRIRPGSGEDLQYVREMSQALSDTGARFCTCHCTDDSAYEVMKEMMGESVQLLRTGDILEI
jgi:7,8-dihydropterin-6-yl-methyl-4-(beta-D-ribofuranosyl)aminobenzene 5'-phosphate synthase